MQFPKQQIMDLIRNQNEPGDSSKADQADNELPQQVDTENDQHQNLLQKFGIDPQQLISKFGGSFGL